MTLTPREGAQHHPHQPFLWSLFRWGDGKTVQTITTAGAPSFKVDLCDLFTSGMHEMCSNQSDFYMCPVSNPGKSYCNYPDHFYCAYWGCETIASAWDVTSENRDKCLNVQFGPLGCKHRGQVYAVYHRGADTIQKGNCKFVWVNVTKPLDSAWLYGKNWGRIGPNEDLGEREISHGILSPIEPGNVTQATITSTPRAIVTPFLENSGKDLGISVSSMWKIINASFQVLNQTNPNITKECWLCVSVRPPYYEALGDTAVVEYSNESNPSKCSWGQEVGITLTQVTGKGRCIGRVPREKANLCNITETGYQPHRWLIPATNTRWVCSSLGVTPCLSLMLLNLSHDFCIQVVIIPRILYHSEEYLYIQHAVSEYHLTKREPITAVTLATLMILGAAGAGTGIASLVKQSQEFTSLRIAVDEDLARIEQSITALEKSVRSLSEVVLQNRRGLDLVFLQQGGLCAALREECCVYADHTGVVRDTMTKLREGLEKRKRENEARQNWYESWFNYSPWLTTLLSTIAGPLLLLILVLTFGPCIFNRVIAIVRSRLEAAHLLLIRARYEPLGQDEDEETLIMSKRALKEFDEQNK